MTRLGTTRLAAVISTPKRYLARCTRREQVSLLAGSVLVVLTAGWLLIWQPVFSARSASQARLMSAQDTLAQVNGMAAELAQLRSAAPGVSVQASSTQSLPQMLNTLAAQMGIAVASLEPAADNQSAGVRFDAVSMSLLLAWLAELESTAGIRVEQLTLTPAGANQSSVGELINASLRIRSVAQ
jgi:type II secretory pathway component PulM